MSKSKRIYFCQNCGHQEAKWMGKCPACGSWNTFTEEILQKEDKKNTWRGQPTAKIITQPRLISEITYQKEKRWVTPDQELNRVLGGGIVPGSVVLIGGEPGIGKSTLLLQIAMSLPLKTLYVSGEESEQQIKMRAERMPIRSEHCYILSENNLQTIFQQVADFEPAILIIDSIQTLQSTLLDSPMGSVSQVRECANELIQYAKETHTPVLMIGHVTKDGSLAGPKVMEHMVDTVLQFEGDRHLNYRILRTMKNRFGSTAELGIYEMQHDGLRQVSNPSEILISQREEALSGVAIAAMLEGNRPLLVEIQALVSPATYGTPQRSTTGFDAKRLNMLLAVLEKRGGFRLGTQDVFLNVAGGLKVEDPAIDLAVCAAIVSSYEEVCLPTTICFAAEVGLGGEIRAVNRIENRIAEAEKLGFREMFISKYNQKSFQAADWNMKIKTVAKLDEVFDRLIGR